MSTLTGRWRCDHATGNALHPVAEWYATEAEAMAREKEFHDRGERAVAWFWPGEYIETPAEEAQRTTREHLMRLLPWLKEAS